MADDLSQHLNRNIPLSEMIATLRQELSVAMENDPDSPLRFELESVDLELTVRLDRSQEANGKVGFWVVEGGGKASSATSDLHVFKLKLKPVVQNHPGHPARVGPKGGPLLSARHRKHQEGEEP